MNASGMSNKRILISRPDRIGDVVLSTALPGEIKKQFPGSYVAILARSYTRDIYLNNPFVDEILIIDEPGTSNIQLIKKIRSRFFTHAIMLLPTEKINWMLFFSGINIRIGVGHKFYQFVTNTKSIYRRKQIPLRHEADYCADAIRKLGVNVTNLDSAIYLTDAEKKKAEMLKKQICPAGEQLIGINSTSGNSAPNISPVEYRKLAEALVQHTEFKVAVTDLVIPDELKNLQGVTYINKGLPLRESIINFSALDLLISASTGPMHIASAVKVPTLSLFCPLPGCSPDLWRPRGNRQEFIFPEPGYCSVECPGDPKKCDFSGEKGISADAIYGRTIRFFTQ